MSYSGQNDDEQYFDDYFNDDFEARRNLQKKSKRKNSANYNIDKYGRKRKELKWKLNALLHNKVAIIALAAVVILIVIIATVSSCSDKKEEKEVASTAATVAPTTQATSYKIEGVPVIVQNELGAACETYACTMLLQSYKFDIDEFEFAEKYLITKPVYSGVDGTLYGPDMNSAYAGDIYTGYGINAPGMAKCMNSYLKTTNSKLEAQPLSGVSLQELCEKYILNDTPVMVWATTYMQEPYIKESWVVDYVDENAAHKIGDTVSWQMHEHCLVLVGFDEKNYYFADSAAGKLASYDKATTEKRYEQIGKQAIVLK